MPVRSPLSSLILQGQRQRLFHTSFILKAHDNNPYETLQVPPNATPSEVKASFYNLSKTHHPDRNPDDPNASQRFVKFAEAYGILSIPAKRQEYDRSLQISSQAAARSQPRGSYHSSGPAGGRPASGLSKRRTQFRGPPPSFYRSGGWGTHEEKRRAAQGQSAPGEESTWMGWYGFGGMRPGQNPFGPENDVRHFDREGHFRTQQSQEQRRQRRTSHQYTPNPERSSMFMEFCAVSGALALGGLLPPLLFADVGKKPRNE